MNITSNKIQVILALNYMHNKIYFGSSHPGLFFIRTPDHRNPLDACRKWDYPYISHTHNTPHTLIIYFSQFFNFQFFFYFFYFLLFKFTDFPISSIIFQAYIYWPGYRSVLQRRDVFFFFKYLFSCTFFCFLAALIFLPR